jgi:molecular chaperone GrpE
MYKGWRFKVMAEEKATQETEQDVTEAEAQNQAAGEIPGADETVELLPEHAALEELKAELEAAQAEAAANKDSELRAQAEMQNVRRRAERDVENAHKFALEKLTGELLPVVDNLERALQAAEAAGESAKAIVEGVEMTLDSFVKALGKFKIEQIDPEGEPFDPQRHQAMSMVENPDVEPNTVVAVLQKGYSLHGRLVRPAMVMVSKAAAAPKIDEQA